MTLHSQQLRWRCRRGVRELDVLFERFLRLEYAQLTESEKDSFAEFLEVQDPVIMDWLFDRRQPEKTNFLPIVTRLKNTAGL